MTPQSVVCLSVFWSLYETLDDAAISRLSFCFLVAVDIIVDIATSRFCFVFLVAVDS